MSHVLRWAAISLPLVINLSACTSGEDFAVGESQAELVISGVTFKADSTIGQDEHCRMTIARRNQFGASDTTVRQVRISASTHLGLCTVEKSTHTQGDNVVLMTLAGMQKRLGYTGAEGGTLTGVTVSDQNASNVDGVATSDLISLHDTYTFTGVQDVREWSSRPAGSQVVFTAPHGKIEPGTGEELERINAANGTRDAFWIAGYRHGSSSNFEHMHITSTDLSEDSFAELGNLFGSPFHHAISLHGFSDSTITHDILVGGLEPIEFRDGVAEIIHDSLLATPMPANNIVLSATTVFSGNELQYNGDSPDNYVNRLAASHGLEIEQSPRVRDTAWDPSAVAYRNAIADATKSVYDCLEESPDVSLTMTSSDTQRILSATSTAYANPGVGTAPRCTRWIAQFDATAATGPVDVWGAPSGMCQPNASSHIDIYRQESGDWRRVGGGWYVDVLLGLFGNPPACYPMGTGQRQYLYASSQPPGVYRVVIRSTTPAGAVGTPQAGIIR